MKIRLVCCAAALLGLAGCASHPANTTSVATTAAPAKTQPVAVVPAVQPVPVLPAVAQPTKAKKGAKAQKESAAEFEARVDAWIRGAAMSATKKS